MSRADARIRGDLCRCAGRSTASARRSKPSRAPREPLRATHGSQRDARLAHGRRTAGSRRRGSPLKRPFYLLDQLRNVVQRKPRPEVAEIAHHYLEGLPWAASTLVSESTAQSFVNELAKRTAGGERLRHSYCRYVVNTA